MYSPRSWFDIVMDTTIGRTVQTDDVDTVEVTPRIGARFHLFSRSLRHHPLERAPARRSSFGISFASKHATSTTAAATWTTRYSSRFRNRLEFLLPLNKERLTDDGARYLLTDWEWFIPLSDQEERFANKQRVRAGLGYRHFPWRFEALYIWTRSRDTIEDDFDTSDNIINVRVKRFFEACSICSLSSTQLEAAGTLPVRTARSKTAWSLSFWPA